MKKKQVLAAFLAAAMCFSMAACGKEEEPEEKTIIVEAHAPEVGDVVVSTNYMGTVAPEEEVSVYPFASGTVTKVNYAVGDVVEKDAVLFTIDSKGAELQMKSAQIQYNTAAISADMQSGSARDVTLEQTNQQIDALRSQRDTYKEAYSDAKDGLKKINSAIKQTTDGITAMQDQLPALQTGLEQAQAAYTQAQAAYDAVKDDETIPAEQKEMLEAAVTQAQTAVEQTQTGIDTLNEQISTANAALGELKTQKATVQSGVDQAQAAYEAMNTQVQNAKKLSRLTQDGVYKDQDKLYAAQKSAAALGIESAQMQLDFYTVKAPISGVVESVTVVENAVAAQSYPAFIISNKDNMVVTFSVTEAAAKALHEGDKIKAVRDEAEYEGTITEVGVMANQQTKLFTVKASLGAAADLSTNVSVIVTADTERAQSVLKIPYDALYFNGGSSYVFVVKDGMASRRVVETGLMNDTEVEITSGLTKDDVVIDTWSSQLKEGVLVAVK